MGHGFTRVNTDRVVFIRVIRGPKIFLRAAENSPDLPGYIAELVGYGAAGAGEYVVNLAGDGCGQLLLQESRHRVDGGTRLVFGDSGFLGDAFDEFVHLCSLPL